MVILQVIGPGLKKGAANRFTVSKGDNPVILELRTPQADCRHKGKHLKFLDNSYLAFRTNNVKEFSVQFFAEEGNRFA